MILVIYTDDCEVIHFRFNNFRFNSLPVPPYSLYKQRESWITHHLREWLPAPPLFIEEVAAWLTEEFVAFLQPVLSLSFRVYFPVVQKLACFQNGEYGFHVFAKEILSGVHHYIRHRE